MTSTNSNDASDKDDNENEECDEIDYDEMIDDAVEFNEVHGDGNNSDIEMYAGDEYVYGEEDDEQDGGAVCSPSVNGNQCELSAVSAPGVGPKTNKARECPGRKRRMVKVTQWSASARANMVKALRERVT